MTWSMMEVARRMAAREPARLAAKYVLWQSRDWARAGEGEYIYCTGVALREVLAEVTDGRHPTERELEAMRSLDRSFRRWKRAQEVAR